MATVQTLISDALGEIGVRSAEEPVNYEDSALALRMLNRMVDQWAAERLTIFSIVRTVADIGNSVGDYELGSAATSVLPFTSSVADGFDSTWDSDTQPPGWTTVQTGSGRCVNSDTIYQAGGHSVRLSALTPPGTVTVSRNFTAFSGTSVTLSVYLRAAAVAGVVRLQCVETGHYLTNTGTWASGVNDVFTSADTSTLFVQSSLTFSTEEASIVGADTLTLKLILYHDDTLGSGSNTYYDTLALTNSVSNVVTPTIQIPRPLYIEDINLIDTNVDPDNETPLAKLDPSGWARIPLKDQTSDRPSAWHYMPSLPTPTFNRNPTFPFGILHLWPVPTGTGFQIAIYAATQINQFAGLASLISLPPGYEEFIVTNLAVRLCEPFERVPKPSLVARAREAKAIVKRSNTPNAQTDMSFDAAVLIGNRGVYDITQG